MSLNEFFILSQWFFLVYFILINGVYLILNINAVYYILGYMNAQSIADLPGGSTEILPPISLIVPAYNEEEVIAESIHALLQLDYPEYEVIIVNDGSTDRTLATIVKSFELGTVPETYRDRLKTQPVRDFYRSSLYPKIRLLDKANGGKADAINAGINVSRYPLFCTIDADSILVHNSLKQVVQPFLESSNTIASGGTIRILNGCKVQRGFLTKPGLPKNTIALFQIVEYLRSFLFGRMGWSPMNALLIISGAFGLFKKEVVVEAGGYSTDTVGEDMELVTRLHRHMVEKKRKYKIVYVPDPICWTEAPEDLETLAKQRIRWQKGLVESLSKNMSLLCKPRGGAVSWLAFPFMLLFEFFGPLFETIGYIIVITGFATGYIALENFIILISVAIGFSILLSTVSILLEELSFHVYARPRDLFKLFLAAIVENFGFRQLVGLYRVVGLIQFMKRGSYHWGEMVRKANWRQPQKPLGHALSHKSLSHKTLSHKAKQTSPS